MEVSPNPQPPQQTNGEIYCSGPKLWANDTSADAPGAWRLGPNDFGPLVDATAKLTRPFKGNSDNKRYQDNSA